MSVTIKKLLQIVEKEEVSLWKSELDELDDQTSSNTMKEPPQLVVQQFSMEALHHTMMNKS